MKELFKSKKVLIGIASVLILSILIVGSIIIFRKNNDKEKNELTQKYVAYVKINPSIKLEYSQTCNKDNMEDCTYPKVISYELINDDAKEIYKDVDLIKNNDNLSNVLHEITQKAKESNIAFDTIDLYSNWTKIDDYLSNNEVDNSLTFNTIIKSDNQLKEIDLLLKSDKKIYTVIFDSDGGSEVNSLTIESGVVISSPTSPTKTGYDFIEWQLNGKKFDFKVPITQDIKLVAIWKLQETNNSSGNKKPANNTQNNTENNSNTDKPLNEITDLGGGFVTNKDVSGYGDNSGEVVYNHDNHYAYHFVNAKAGCKDAIDKQACKESWLRYYRAKLPTYENMLAGIPGLERQISEENQWYQEQMARLDAADERAKKYVDTDMRDEALADNQRTREKITESHNSDIARMKKDLEWAKEQDRIFRKNEQTIRDLIAIYEAVKVD